MTQELIPIGRVLGAFGIKGEVRVKPFSVDPSNLVSIARGWLLRATVPASEKRPAVVQSARVVAGGVALKFESIDDRDAAQALAGLEWYVKRTELGKAEEDAFYWLDLIDCEVSNTRGVALGRVNRLIATGVHDVLCLTPPDRDAANERLIPFISIYVKSVDVANKKLVIDWDESWD